MRRLRRTSEIQRALRAGLRVHLPWAVLYARRRGADEDGPGARVGVIAGRRFSGAVARNRARRRLREACRAALAAGETRGDWDIVLVARSQVNDTSYRALLSEVTAGLRESGVLPEKAVLSL